MQLLEGRRKIGSHIPPPMAAKDALVNILVTILFLSPSKIQSPMWYLFSPFCPSNAFISIRGWGDQQELGGFLRFHSPPSQMARDLEDVVNSHSIWGLAGVLALHNQGLSLLRTMGHRSLGFWRKKA